MSDKHHHAKKERKKLAMLLRNRRAGIQAGEDALARERDLEKEREEEREKASMASGRTAAKHKKEAAEPAWSARMQQIRDKNTGRMRMADDRWNRFAGTESGGGRGL